MSKFQQISYANVLVNELDTECIRADPVEVENGLKSRGTVMNFNIGYDNGRNRKGQRVKIQSTFMNLPYGISSFSQKDNPTAKSSYTMTVGFQHSADEKTKNNAEKFNLVQQDKIEKLAKQMKTMDVAVMKSLLAHPQFRSEFFRMFKNKLKNVDLDTPNYQQIVDTLMPVSSSYVEYDPEDDPEQKKYPYDVMKIRVIYGTNPDSGDRKYYLNMAKLEFNDDSPKPTSVPVPETKYEEIFGSELRGAIARFQFQPQFWILTTGEKKCGIKYILKGIEYIPFKAPRQENGNQGMMYEEDEGETALMSQMSKLKVKSAPAPVEEEDAQEVEEEESEEEVEEEDEESEEEVVEPEPEPKKSGRGRKKV